MNRGPRNYISDFVHTLVQNNDVMSMTPGDGPFLLDDWASPAHLMQHLETEAHSSVAKIYRSLIAFDWCETWTLTTGLGSNFLSEFG